MRLLKMAVNGLTLFKGAVNIDFFAEQRVSSDNNEMVSPCFGSVYTNMLCLLLVLMHLERRLY
mgnify:CR=1 FL=1